MKRETIGSYEIQSERGRGGVSTVYLSHAPIFHRNAVIKVVSVNHQEKPVFRDFSEREARLIAKLVRDRGSG